MTRSADDKRARFLETAAVPSVLSLGGGETQKWRLKAHATRAFQQKEDEDAD